MKILYLVPKINTEGGLERVLCLKANYLVEHFHHDVSIVTQNNGNTSLFYPLNDKIHLYDINLSGNRIQFVAKYLKEIKRIVALVNPDVLIVADSTYKAYLVTLIVKNKRIIYECHNSIYVQLGPSKKYFYMKWIPNLKLRFHRYVANKMTDFVALSKDSMNEWQQPNGVIIPNPNWLKTTETANLDSKKILIIARHSYEKGLDCFFSIWKQIAYEYPDWQVEIYGKTSDELNYKTIVNQLGIGNSIQFLEPVKAIESKYLEASIYVMTSRYEAFPMVLIEAMSCGLPVIAYDCPCGPRAIISNNKNGILIKNGNQSVFVEELQKLIESKETRKRIGATAKKDIEKYNLEAIMNQWNSFLLSKRD